VKDPGKSLALIAAGLGFLYFGWLFFTTGIFAGRRGRVVIMASEDPERFSYVLAVVIVLGIASLVAGIVTLLRR
jgi:hypothetical protein